MVHTYTSDVQILIQFAKDQGWDCAEVVEAYCRLDDAIAKELTDYSIHLDE